ncbi:UDP-N-acetylmuramoylalanyl-D-glutamate--2,6-diaminopimelate ligase [hydrothermal vent metagenome]|uniref:UDP-N-acetylmuramoylalanyl-D-glutamate--2,6-diaminopimelate ligase n=1 Tax=hydrothermal vent metagenome TaxID=652676 RepID=A0A3B0UX27_9ZZZZ
MKNLRDILNKAGVENISGNEDVAVANVLFDSRKVQPGDVFVAVSGTQVDGHLFIDSAVRQGAVAVVCEVLPQNINTKVVWIKVKDSAFALGQMAANFYNRPSEKLKLVGVTGTNGKTTIVTLLHQLFLSLGYKVGMLSTIINKVNQKEIKASHTTPDALSVNRILSEMVSTGCAYAFMEVSSHAIVQERIAGLQFAGALFTNITHDHLDYHKTFKEYISAKKKLFDDLPQGAFALVNADDRNARIMLQNTRAKQYSYALKTMADFRGRLVEDEFSGLQMLLDNKDFYSPMVGAFNASNLLAVYATSVLLEQDKLEILSALSVLRGAEGRFEVIHSPDGVVCIVDYAHTPDALKNVLETIRAISSRNEQLITVVGAGGDRDKTKRPEMAAIATALSNRVILTSDNPRSENPEDILRDMKAGVDQAQMKNTLVITDRREAIKTAYVLASEGDIILIAGKGHEKYQEINGVRFPFDDKQVLTELFETQ